MRTVQSLAALAALAALQGCSKQHRTPAPTPAPTPQPSPAPGPGPSPPPSPSPGPGPPAKPICSAAEGAVVSSQSYQCAMQHGACPPAPGVGGKAFLHTAGLVECDPGRVSVECQACLAVADCRDGTSEDPAECQDRLAAIADGASTSATYWEEQMQAGKCEAKKCEEQIEEAQVIAAAVGVLGGGSGKASTCHKPEAEWTCAAMMQACFGTDFLQGDCSKEKVLA